MTKMSDDREDQMVNYETLWEQSREFVRLAAEVCGQSDGDPEASAQEARYAVDTNG